MEDDTKSLVISFRDVSKEFDSLDSAEAADNNFGVKDLNFTVKKGEVVAIVGPTGCGKSTTFSLLVGLAKPSKGEIEVIGCDPYRQFNKLKGKVGIVFQNDRLLPWRSAIDNAAIALEVSGVSKEKRRRAAAEWLGRIGLSDYETKYPHELSGGMKQRVAIARAFVMDPEIILCDESFSALDELTASKLRKEFLQLVRKRAKTGLFITHSIDEAIEMSDRVLVFLKPGHVAREIFVPHRLSVSERANLHEEILNAMDVG